uniref:CCDC92 domain-containing protein n=1 Tax=Parastrongyloides trichosuri TaxID=131310 RepID=A0A0N4ZGV1_PARTI
MSSGHGLREMDAIRDQIALMRQEEQRVRRLRLNEMDGAYRTALISGLLGRPRHRNRPALGPLSRPAAEHAGGNPAPIRGAPGSKRGAPRLQRRAGRTGPGAQGIPGPPGTAAGRAGADQQPAGGTGPVAGNPARRSGARRRRPNAQGARTGAGQPVQVRLPGQHVPRAAHPAQFSADPVQAPGGQSRRDPVGGTGQVRPHHPVVRQRSAGPDQRHPGPVQDRGRPHPGAPGSRLDAAADRGHPRRRHGVIGALGPPHRPGDRRPLARDRPADRPDAAAASGAAIHPSSRRGQHPRHFAGRLYVAADRGGGARPTGGARPHRPVQIDHGSSHRPRAPDRTRAQGSGRGAGPSSCRCAGEARAAVAEQAAPDRRRCRRPRRSHGAFRLRRPIVPVRLLHGGLWPGGLRQVAARQCRLLGSQPGHGRRLCRDAADLLPQRHDLFRPGSSGPGRRPVQGFSGATRVPGRGPPSPSLCPKKKSTGNASHEPRLGPGRGDRRLRRGRPGSARPAARLACRLSLADLRRPSRPGRPQQCSGASFRGQMPARGQGGRGQGDRPSRGGLFRPLRLPPSGRSKRRSGPVSTENDQHGTADSSPAGRRSGGKPAGAGSSAEKRGRRLPEGPFGRRSAGTSAGS